MPSKCSSRIWSANKLNLLMLNFRLSCRRQSNLSRNSTFKSVTHCARFYLNPLQAFKRTCSIPPSVLRCIQIVKPILECRCQVYESFGDHNEVLLDAKCSHSRKCEKEKEITSLSSRQSYDCHHSWQYRPSTAPPSGVEWRSRRFECDFCIGT